jgi:hypothetical protein
MEERLEDNNGGLVLRLDMGDLPLVVKALTTQRDHAVKGGRSEQRLQILLDTVKDALPKASELFNDSEWYDLIQALQNASEVNVEWREHTWRRGSGSACVVVDGSVFSARETVPEWDWEDSPHVEDLRHLVSMVAPASAVKSVAAASL